MFVNVTVNGDDIGVMALEEHFAKELLEYNGRKEGVIIRYDESLVWKATDGNRGFGGAFDNYLNAKIDAFSSSKIRKSMRLSRENATAVGLLRSFASGDLDASDVFDAKQLAGFLAVSEFFRSQHAVRWHNLRFYFNPISMKLEPIGFDGDINHPSLYPMPLSAEEPILREMFKDPIILKSYHVILKNIIDDFKSGELVSFLKEKEKIPLSQLRREFYFLDSFNYDQLNHYEKMITTDYRYNKIKAEKYPAFIHAFLINENDSRYVEISNALPFPVEISSIKWREKSGNLLEFKSKDTFSLPLVLKPNELIQYARPLRLNFHAAPKTDKITLEIISNIQDSDVTKKTIASKYHTIVDTPPLPTIDISNLLEIHPYLFISEKNIISVKKGEWIVDNHIIIPSEYTFFIPEKVILRFNNKAGLISYGAVVFDGTKNNPITLTGKLINGSGKEATWQGIAVLHSKKRSSLTHTIISNTTGISQNSWSLTAGTTFYMSDVTINNCTFVNNKCEDALNIIHSDFLFNKIVMKNCSSDAFDSDFSTGEILQGYFQDIGYDGGGDGVDISGSTVSLKDSHFIRVDDKAISIGERSTFNGERITIEDSGVAVVSKDDSVVNIMDSVIKNCKTASLMAYVKKPEYGPSKLFGINISITGNAKEAIVQDKSKIVLNGKTIETKALNVDSLYDTVMKPGLKK